MVLFKKKKGKVIGCPLEDVVTRQAGTWEFPLLIEAAFEGLRSDGMPGRTPLRFVQRTCNAPSPPQPSGILDMDACTCSRAVTGHALRSGTLVGRQLRRWEQGTRARIQEALQVSGGGYANLNALPAWLVPVI